MPHEELISRSVDLLTEAGSQVSPQVISQLFPWSLFHFQNQNSKMEQTDSKQFINDWLEVCRASDNCKGGKKALLLS